MKKVTYFIYITLICIAVQANGQTVGFTYDGDGNMQQRKIVIVPPQGAKAVIDEPKPVTEEIGEQKVTIYPIPTKGLFQVSVTLLDGKKKNYFSLYSLSGAQLMVKNLSNEYTDIDISTYPAGTYLLDVFLGDKVSRWKVIKQ